MRIDLNLCVNNRYGNVPQTCRHVELLINGDIAIHIECDLPFLEIPDNVIQIDNQCLQWCKRRTMVGNVFWNSYGVALDDAILLLNNLKQSPKVSVTEAWSEFWDRFESPEMFDLKFMQGKVG